MMWKWNKLVTVEKLAAVAMSGKVCFSKSQKLKNTVLSNFFSIPSQQSLKSFPEKQNLD